MGLEVNYSFELAPVRGAWKRIRQNILAPWLIHVRIFLRNPNDFDAIIHELVESYIAQLLHQRHMVDYRKACRIAHVMTIISLPTLKG